ncbi:MAG: ribosome biogenesis GTP-binding protein YihA/YsxC [Lachnospiraceae bacterium]|nr:ribosome biogenesis GTP-binding protein YihA/YsxC [Lachnospiraceae bacterium]
MKIRKVNLDTVCGITSKFPETSFPEFAFLGRSNVGKSSLINTLMQRKNYARTSGDPGKTQTVNYYNINDMLYLVDLPGYGYAKVSRTTREKWGKMIERYLTGSPSLCLIFLLVDSRHAPTQDDRMMAEWLLYHKLPVAVIATKVDKLKKSERDAQLNAVRDALGFPEDGIFIPFSSATKEGREELLAELEKRININCS